MIKPSLHPFVRKPRHKWFAHLYRNAEDGWNGPHDHIEDAVRDVLLAWACEADDCWVAQGRKMTKAEIEEIGAQYTWEVDARNAIHFVLPAHET